MKRKSRALTRDQMDAAFEFWVKELGLDRWHIVWDFYSEPPPVEDLECTQGESVGDAVNHTGSIKILPLDLWNDPETPHDMEQVLVHELLHCKYDMLWRSLPHDSVERDLLHEIIDENAWLLVEGRNSESKSLSKKATGKKAKCRK